MHAAGDLSKGVKNLLVTTRRVKITNGARAMRGR